MEDKVELKPLAEFNDRNKETVLSLMISKPLKEIEKLFTQWVEDVFKEGIVHEDVYTSNLISSVDYLFTEAIWLLELAEGLGYDMKDNRRHLEYQYEKYTESDLGYRYLHYIPHYDARNHKYLNEEETKERQRKSNETMNKIIQEMKDEGKLNFLK